ncbi:MAG TPA: STAS domain-containing protein [Candidatus Hydrogenedentes bacterium]|nr:STAS domain-containing protein [Candidatus Hydrogenedentota bacterium]HNT87058.1 STAS domain-containing protein [Candidatus Hydrogenedentota bacterium]
MALELLSVEQDGQWVIRAKGEVDLYASPDLRAAILKAVSDPRGGVAVDLSQVEYMDSSGVATLVEGLKSAGQRKVSFSLLAPSQAVMKVLQLSRLDSVFDIRESL